MTWQMVWEAIKGSAMFTPVFMCVLFCMMLLYIGVKEYGWMIAVKVAAILVFAILMAAVFSLFIDWIFGRWN